MSDSMFSVAFDVLIKISESYRPHIPSFAYQPSKIALSKRKYAIYILEEIGLLDYEL